MTQSGRLDATFAALADPTRRAILARLASGEASVTELAKPFAMSQPAISRHLRVPDDAGLISRGRDRQANPMQKITPFLWFDSNAEEAVKFYASIFKNSKIGAVGRYGKEGFEIHKRPAGSAMTVEFQLEGPEFIALNGGPAFRFNESISFQVHCATQEEVDYYWDGLSEGGDKKAQQCGWLKDQFGLSWQIIPSALPRLLGDPDRAKAGRVMQAMLQMKKIDIAKLEQAYEG